MLETSIYYYPDGTWSYGVDLGFVECVRNFLFDTGILIPSDPLYFNNSAGKEWVTYRNIKYRIPVDYDTFKFNYIYGGSHKYIDCCLMHGSTTYYFSGTNNPLTTSEAFEHNGTLYGIVYDQNYTSDIDPMLSSGSIALGDLSGVTLGALSPLEYACKVILSGHLSGLYGSSVTSDYQLGVVSPLEVPMPGAYPEWHANARPATNPDSDEEITVLPIPLNPSADPETQIGTLTQPNIWQGTIADPMPDMQPDPNPNPDPGTNPGTGVPSDIGDYQIDLKKFFPFCIPFDLYDFFSCLAADPVAPVIEWVIPLPGGDTYPLEIDLSAFDGVAQLLRRLQLLLFCVGLAFKTRDLIKG